MEKDIETKVVNVKVKFIRPKYKDLEEWMKDPNHVYIGRAGAVFIKGTRFPRKGSNWGNPFTVKQHGYENCLVLYEEWLRSKIEAEGTEFLKKLKGKQLGCWCKPERCHGDILKKVLEEVLEKEQ